MNRNLIAIPTLALVLLANAPELSAANVVWVSDAAPAGFSGPGAGLTDQGFVELLQRAGHNVTRYNSPDSQTTLLTQAEVNALNTNDLIILGRASNSPQFQSPQGSQWNTNITKPLIVMSPYFVRPDGGRFGWFSGGTLPDDIPTVLSAGNPANSAVDFLFADVAMNGTNTVFNYDELLDRNTSHIQNAPVAGAIVYASFTFPNEAGGALTTAYGIVGFPAGTIVGTDLVPLASYRMFISGGCRESSTAPNTIWYSTGRENLTPTGEDIFLRAVQLALNSGVPPSNDPAAPILVTNQPGSETVLEGLPVSFSITVTGAAPRTVQWQRDIGDGVTFTNIPGASTPFSKSIYSLPAATTADNGARLRVSASNNQGTIFSDVVTLTVTEDVAPPVPVSAGSVDGTRIDLHFDELVDTNGSATDAFAYNINEAGGVVVSALTATLGPDGRSVILTLDNTLGSNFTIRVVNVADRHNNAIAEPGVTLVGTNLELTAANVGALNPGGDHLFSGSNRFQAIGGGLDVRATADQLRYLYRTVTGDFDARVRVMSLTGTNRLEAVAKALLTVRESVAEGSAAVNVFVTPPAPGDDLISSSYRPSTGADNRTNTPAFTATKTRVFVPAGLPNAWMRITRVGDVFTMYRGTNGTTWVEMGNATLTLPAALNVGVGAVSHRNGEYAIATFSDFTVGPLQSATPTLVGPAFAAGVFSASFDTQVGVSYTVQYRDVVDSGIWSPLTNVIGNGAVVPFADPGPVSSTGSRFYRVQAP